MKYGIYIHVPFCRSKCDYCSFYSVPVRNADERHETVGVYVRRLIVELERRLPAFSDHSADTIYFGGGTPSLLEPDEVNRILGTIGRHMTIDPGAEVTIEVNPEDARRVRLAGFRDAGVNRAVLGAQTIDPGIHTFIGRSTGLCNAGILDEFFGVAGIIHCVDVITGVPGSTGSDPLGDLKCMVTRKPAHISAYVLSVEKETPLYGRVRHAHAMEGMQREVFEMTRAYCTGAGYIHYEISNYSLPGCESKHNMKYWTFQPYLGFGPGSHSFYNHKRFINSMSVDTYLSSRAEELIEDVRGENADLVEYVLTGLRLINGISINEMERLLDKQMPDAVMRNMYELYDSGLLDITKEEGDRRIRLTDSGLNFADSVIYKALEPIV